MIITKIILGLAALYSFCIYIASRFLVPFMSFSGFKAPAKIPEEIKAAILDLELRATSERTYLEAAYELVLDKTLHQWHHTRFAAATHLHRAFVKDLGEIWLTKKFLYCTAINYLLFTLLVGSKYFKTEDVKVRHVFVNFFIHQYLKVKVNGGWVDVDPAGTGIRAKPLGTHLAGFG